MNSSEPTTAAVDHRYPEGTVIKLLDGPLMTPATARAVRARLTPTADGLPPAVLTKAQYALLTQVAARLLPQTDRAVPIDCAGEFHRRLRTGTIGDGWRYADLPPDAEAFCRGLDLVAASAMARFGGCFGDASPFEQDGLLRDIQLGQVDTFGEFSSVRWFEEVLAALVDIYYSQPVALDEIGYAGMADARGWQAVGVGARAPHEPKPIT